MLIQWYHNGDRNSLHFSHLLAQAGSALLETAVWEGDIETVGKHLKCGANVNYQKKVIICHLTQIHNNYLLSRMVSVYSILLARKVILT